MKGVPLDDITRAPFVPPVDPSKFASLFMLLGTIGIAFTMWFFVYVADNRILLLYCVFRVICVLYAWYAAIVISSHAHPLELLS